MLSSLRDKPMTGQRQAEGIVTTVNPLSWGWEMDHSATVIIVESNPIYREGLLEVMQQAGFRGCLAFSSTAEIKAGLPKENLLVLADLGSDPELITGGMELIYRICPNAQIVLLADALDERRLAEALKAGVAGLVLKFVVPEVLVKSIELVLLGQQVFPAQILQALQLRRVKSEPDRPDVRSALKSLSIREADVLEYMCMGDANKVIAHRMGIAEATVKVHVKAILRKLGARNRTEAALRARPHEFAWQQNSSHSADPGNGETGTADGTPGSGKMITPNSQPSDKAGRPGNILLEIH